MCYIISYKTDGGVGYNSPMKRIIVVLLLIIFAGVWYVSQKQIPSVNQLLPTSVPTPPETLITESKKSIFIPYWSVGDETLIDVSEYDRLIYFGITPNRSGINTSEVGYVNLKKFVSHVPAGSKKLLTVRMVDTNRNAEILQNDKTWDIVIDETIAIAQEYGFDGVVLDLEESAAPFTSVVDRINKFTSAFYKASKQNNLYFAITLYGDFNYRKRPYDLSVLVNNTDEIMIMSYDLHKARGEPGPNFPLRGKEKYDYDLETLLNDLRGVSKDKLTFVFGMYGYDWTVDETKKPIKPAKALSYLNIQKEFLTKCEWKNCLVIPDELSAETEVNYIDTNGYYHIVWFEDNDSAEAKQKFLQQHGINSFSYWTYGYF